MKTPKCRILRACMKRWRSMERREYIPFASVNQSCRYSFWHSLNEDRVVPSDVPKGHLAIYVGECHKRYVIKITLLKNPLFQSLLDQAKEVYDFTTDSRLCIPCDENMFLSVIQSAKSPSDRRVSFCL